MPVNNNVGSKPVRVVRAGDGPGVLVNRDLFTAGYTGEDVSITGQNVNAFSVHDPLVGIPYDGDRDVWAISSGASPITFDYIKNAQNWTPSPAQVQAQLQPALQSAGTAGPQTPAQSGNPIVVFQGTGRIWSVTLSGVVAAGAAYAAAFNSAWFTLLLVQNSVSTELAEIVLAVQVANTVDNDSIAVSFPSGIPMHSGDQIQLNINNSNSIANANIRATGSVIFSTP